MNFNRFKIPSVASIFKLMLGAGFALGMLITADLLYMLYMSGFKLVFYNEYFTGIVHRMTGPIILLYSVTTYILCFKSRKPIFPILFIYPPALYAVFIASWHFLSNIRKPDMMTGERDLGFALWYTSDDILPALALTIAVVVLGTRGLASK